MAISLPLISAAISPALPALAVDSSFETILHGTIQNAVVGKTLTANPCEFALDDLWWQPNTSNVFVHNYFEDVEKVKDAIQFEADTVFYPQGGTDALFALTSFPAARTFIIVDQQPFLEIKGVLSEWNNALGPMTLLKLKLGNPQIRIREAYAFTVAGEASTLHFDGRTEYQPLHGLVLFDLGEHTTLKSIMYVNGNLTDSTLKSDRWWLAYLERSKPTAFIIKNATQTFKKQFNPNLYQWIFSAAQNVRGIVVDADGVAESSLAGIRQMTILPLYLGYAKDLAILEF